MQVCAGTFGDNKWMLNKEIWKHIFFLFFFLKYSLFLPRSLRKINFFMNEFVQCGKDRTGFYDKLNFEEIIVSRLKKQAKMNWIEFNIYEQNLVFVWRLKTNNLLDLEFFGVWSGLKINFSLSANVLKENDTI